MRAYGDGLPSRDSDRHMLEVEGHDRHRRVAILTVDGQEAVDAVEWINHSEGLLRPKARPDPFGPFCILHAIALAKHSKGGQGPGARLPNDAECAGRNVANMLLPWVRAADGQVRDVVLRRDAAQVAISHGRRGEGIQLVVNIRASFRWVRVQFSEGKVTKVGPNEPRLRESLRSHQRGQTCLQARVVGTEDRLVAGHV